MSKIFIDPGHGAHDPGAVGKRSKEKDNVLKVGLRLKTILEAAGHNVRMSRSTDVFIPLSTRAQMANAWGADYFVSLHDNAATSSVSGFETFIHDGSVQSKTSEFQRAIHDAIIKSIGIKDRGKKRANFAVLRETKMPAVLVEYAFITNDKDESILISEVEQLARSTAEGITAHAGGVVRPATTKPTTNTPTSKVNETDLLDLSQSQLDEYSNVFKNAREKGIFSSSEHEKDVKAGKMTESKAVYLTALIASAALNNGVRTK